MKRLLCLIVTVIMLLATTACDSKDNEIQKPANFYYCTANIGYDSEYGVIAYEVRETAEFSDDLITLVNNYICGPISQTLVSPFPSGSGVMQINQNDTEITLIMNLQFAKLTGLKLSLACACLCKTIFPLTSAESITIRCRDSSLDGKTSIVLKRDSLLLQDKSLIQVPVD